jgi:hypothetical protein
MDAAWALVTARDVGGGRIVSNAFVLIKSLFKLI